MLSLRFLHLMPVTVATDSGVGAFPPSSSLSWNCSGYNTFSGVCFSCKYTLFIGFKEERGEEMGPVLLNRAFVSLL